MDATVSQILETLSIDPVNRSTSPTEYELMRDRDMSKKSMNGILHPITAVIALCVFMSMPRAESPLVGQPSTNADADRLLNGAIDIHLHIDPRPYGADISTLRLAASRGVRGVVIKNHYEPTVDLSLLLRREVTGIEIFGGVDLNHVVGGVNAAIVEHMGEALGGSGGFRGREPLAPRTGIVWMPTFDSENAVRAANQTRPFLTVSRNGELVSEVKRVISVIAKYGLVLATGHNSADEALMILREGRAQGVQHMVVTHAMDNPIFMDIPQMKEAVELGAIIEFDYRLVLSHEDQLEAIRQLGTQHAILSEFLMPTGGSEPLQYAGLDSMNGFVAGMRAHGFTDGDLDLMLKENPARLLGL